jgi:hypothetical protein
MMITSASSDDLLGKMARKFVIEKDFSGNVTPLLQKKFMEIGPILDDCINRGGSRAFRGATTTI